MTNHFADDKEWAKFRILELAERAAPRKDPDTVLEIARKFEKFIMPAAAKLTLIERKDAKKN
jgi:hypothetical protein